ncbi:MAG: hypothetical protein IPM39_28515 [Chloroflexi bacterium]|nr:hypothetical protein [Chloroflexota bacterium]
MAQQLLLRGSRDFASLAVYETFLFDIMDKRNKRREMRLREELAVMRLLSATPLPTTANCGCASVRAAPIRVLRRFLFCAHVAHRQNGRTVVIHEWSLRRHVWSTGRPLRPAHWQ